MYDDLQREISQIYLILGKLANMSGIGIISNPYSRLNRKNPGRKHLLGYIVGEKGKLEITNSLEDIKRVAESFKKNNIEILAINGGDGTISQTLTAFLNIYKDPTMLPKICLLKGGTMNVLAQNLSMKGSPEHILFKLVEAYSDAQKYENKMKIQKLQSLIVEGQLGFLFANGCSAYFLDEYYKIKNGRFYELPFLFLKLYIGRYFSETYYKNIVFDQVFEVSTLSNNKLALEVSKCVSIFCSTILKLPLGFKFFKLLPRLSLHHPQFQVNEVKVLAKDLPKRLPLVALGLHKSEELSSMLCTNLQIKEQHAKEKMLYTLDGELFRAKTDILEIKLGPTIEFVSI